MRLISSSMYSSSALYSNRQIYCYFWLILSRSLLGLSLSWSSLFFSIFSFINFSLFLFDSLYSCLQYSPISRRRYPKLWWSWLTFSRLLAISLMACCTEGCYLLRSGMQEDAEWLLRYLFAPARGESWHNFFQDRRSWRRTGRDLCM